MRTWKKGSLRAAIRISLPSGSIGALTACNLLLSDLACCIWNKYSAHDFWYCSFINITPSGLMSIRVGIFLIGKVKTFSLRASTQTVCLFTRLLIYKSISNGNWNKRSSLCVCITLRVSLPLLKLFSTFTTGLPLLKYHWLKNQLRSFPLTFSNERRN